MTNKKPKRTITLFVIYGSFDKHCRLHVVDKSTGRRLGDNRIPKYNLGRAGTFKSVDCKKCRSKLDAMIKDPDVAVFDGWTGEEAK